MQARGTTEMHDYRIASVTDLVFIDVRLLGIVFNLLQKPIAKDVKEGHDRYSFQDSTYRGHDLYCKRRSADEEIAGTSRKCISRVLAGSK